MPTAPDARWISFTAALFRGNDLGPAPGKSRTDGAAGPRRCRRPRLARWWPTPAVLSRLRTDGAPQRRPRHPGRRADAKPRSLLNGLLKDVDSLTGAAPPSTAARVDADRGSERRNRRHMTAAQEKGDVYSFRTGASYLAPIRRGVRPAVAGRLTGIPYVRIE